MVRLAILAALMLVSPQALAVPSVGSGLGLPPDASVEGHRIDELVRTTLVAITILFVMMVTWMLVSCFRHGRTHKAWADDGRGFRGKVVPMGMALLVLFVVDGNLLAHSTADMDSVFWNFARPEANAETVRLEVYAHQWAWDVRYAGPDGSFNTADDVVTLNEIRVPVGAPVLVQVSSSDVVHGFYLPNFRVKIDAVPGSFSRAWFTAAAPGEFEIACAQHCGANHYKMGGRLIVMPKAEFAEWYAAAAARARVAYDPEDPGAQWGWSWEKAKR